MTLRNQEEFLRLLGVTTSCLINAVRPELVEGLRMSGDSIDEIVYRLCSFTSHLEGTDPWHSIELPPLLTQASSPQERENWCAMG